jgi:hypothetical protein
MFHRFTSATDFIGGFAKGGEAVTLSHRVVHHLNCSERNLYAENP